MPNLLSSKCRSNELPDRGYDTNTTFSCCNPLDKNRAVPCDSAGHCRDARSRKNTTKLALFRRPQHKYKSRKLNHDRISSVSAHGSS
jgi:hypothetical protein